MIDVGGLVGYLESGSIVQPATLVEMFMEEMENEDYVGGLVGLQDRWQV